MVQKIIDYDDGGYFGDWRNRVTFVDDEDNEPYMRDADELADWVRLNQSNLNVNKIYLDAFAQVNAAVVIVIRQSMKPLTGNCLKEASL